MSLAPAELLKYLRELGWSDVELLPPPPAAETFPPVGSPAPVLSSGAGGSAGELLAALAAQLADCRRCRLCEGRTQVVFGVGNPQARLMFIGEGPGQEEDRLGEPFVGRAGKLLDAMLRALGLPRREVYIANVVKCRPPGNRDPQDDEVAACRPFLERQVELVNPQVIVTLGRVAARHLLGRSEAMRDLRGRWISWRGRRVLPTYHPAFLLRTPSAKAEAWRDLKEVRRSLSLAGGEAGPA
ncbi:MAG: uracil-DNA glycosylase [Acidobacteriota bacterium]|jgi:DNA polymerase